MQSAQALDFLAGKFELGTGGGDSGFRLLALVFGQLFLQSERFGVDHRNALPPGHAITHLDIDLADRAGNPGSHGAGPARHQPPQDGDRLGKLLPDHFIHRDQGIQGILGLDRQA